nr:PREDICTED: dehydrogenase/reductase SDR family member 12 [Opisthocomus hoazin]
MGSAAKRSRTPQLPRCCRREVCERGASRDKSSRAPPLRLTARGQGPSEPTAEGSPSRLSPEAGFCGSSARSHRRTGERIRHPRHSQVTLLLYDSTKMRQLLSKSVVIDDDDDDEYPWRQNAHKSGHESASRRFNPADVEVDVAGRSFLVTGANSGIGKATAKEIARRGGTIHLVCRNKERAEVSKGEIVTETGNQNIFLHIVDISNPKEIWKFAEKFKNEHKLNVLINNAGCMVNNRELTEDGLEKNFATNTLGTYILTTALLPLLEKEADARVVTVSSGGMLVQKLNISDLQSENGTFDGTMVYAQNKRQQVVMTEQWAKAHRNIHFSVMHPGWADTPAVRSSMPDFYQKMKNILRTEAQGADTVVWLAVSSEATKLPSGLFFQDRQPVPTHLPLASTRSLPEDEEKLMEVLEEFSQKFKSTSPAT